jgi:hypothetical protein
MDHQAELVDEEHQPPNADIQKTTLLMRMVSQLAHQQLHQLG